MSVPRILAATALGAASVLAIAGCSASPATAPTASAPAASSVTIEDNNGTHEIKTPPTAVVATDNRTFQTLSDWGIELKAAAVALMPDSSPYKKDEKILDLGNHIEPKLETVVAAEPDLIINGQRFASFHDDLVTLVPDATVIELDPREGKPFDEELRRQVTVLGEIFGKQKEAEKLVADFDAAVDRAKDAYQKADKVMAVNTSGGEIGYIAPTVGRTLGPIFDLIGMTPALEVPEASTNHKGDDISVEAIATSNPDWILVMDRDASFSAKEPSFKPAAEILEGSEALAGVTAVTKKQIVYMPSDTYLNESIQTYTTFLNDLADAFEKSAKGAKG
ncbi:iron complex transport system substrate-binding protein [Microbacterium resistens]|uniref:Iron complex transport system substrate-binding protein n=1 Tax=Microbacterium resistens TaxID=156977 RepID=A0ABU1SAN6_9MICO|nr:ABC transporter substrate-binding protein [Microbacterium resistens]MDR6866649.1 iron complex transport system substrate-binding protein [Microbacterium resistens]